MIGFARKTWWRTTNQQGAQLKSAELFELLGADPRKVAMARAIWTQTTVWQGWLAELGMKSAANVSQLIRRVNLAQTSTELPREFRQRADRLSKKMSPDPRLPPFLTPGKGFGQFEYAPEGRYVYHTCATANILPMDF